MARSNHAPNDYSVLSDKTCEHPGCVTLLKLNLVEKNPEAVYCYRHWRLRWRSKPGRPQQRIVRHTLTNLEAGLWSR